MTFLKVLIVVYRLFNGLYKLLFKTLFIAFITLTLIVNEIFSRTANNIIFNYIVEFLLFVTIVNFFSAYFYTFLFVDYRSKRR